MSELKFANYGQTRPIDCTNAELEMFNIIEETAGEKLQLVRKSDNYVTAMLRGWDLARFKFTPRAKWIAFPAIEVGPPKHRIQSVDDVRTFSESFEKSIETIKKYQ